MKRINPVLLALALAACSDRSGSENEVVDTTLNDAPSAQVRTSDTTDLNISRTPSATRQGELLRSRRKTKVDLQANVDEDLGDSEEYKFQPAGAQSAKGDLRSLFSADDYPAAASAAEAQGTAQAVLTISPTGQVVGCNLIQSTGNGSLDAATCNVLRRRARFTPARDSDGNAVTDTVTTPPIVWRLEG